MLVDRYSASSSEIVAAALRDHHRATLVGERTFGKALVQSIDPLDNGAALELTIARYYTPSGADISDVGVAPQIHAARRPRARRQDDALATALQRAGTARAVARRTGYRGPVAQHRRQKRPSRSRAATRAGTQPRAQAVSDLTVRLPRAHASSRRR